MGQRGELASETRIGQSAVLALPGPQIKIRSNNRFVIVISQLPALGSRDDRFHLLEELNGLAAVFVASCFFDSSQIEQATSAVRLHVALASYLDGRLAPMLRALDTLE